MHGSVCTGQDRRLRDSGTSMSKAISGPTRMVAYLPSLRTILQRLRATSTTPSSLNPTLMVTSTPLETRAAPLTSSTTVSEVTKVSPGTFSDALQTSSALVSSQLHPQFPLPGSVGLSPSLLSPNTSPSQPTTTSSTLSDDISDNQEFEDVPTIKTLISDRPQGTVECMVQECPSFLHSELMQLFPGVAVKSGKLTVVTLSEKTKNDMTGWSQAVEGERELLLEHFIDSAKEICSRLTGAGYWADFIEPSSGRAFYSPYSNATLFETDERFKYLGFDITDLGCCKSIHHPIWGAFTFVGTIFTDAPSSSPVIRTVMEL